MEPTAVPPGDMEGIVARFREIADPGCRAFACFLFAYRSLSVRAVSDRAVRVENLPGRGRGLLANRRLEPGETVAVYPADGLAAESDNAVAQLFKFPPVCGGDHREMMRYASSVTSLEGLSHIVADPGKEQWPMLGHLVNDAIGDPFGGAGVLEAADPLAVYRAALRYYIDGEAKANAVIQHGKVPVTIEIVREVAENEEVVALYGATYWLPPGGEICPETLLLSALQKSEPELAASAAAAMSRLHRRYCTAPDSAAEFIALARRVWEAMDPPLPQFPW